MASALVHEMDNLEVKCEFHDDEKLVVLPISYVDDTVISCVGKPCEIFSKAKTLSRTLQSARKVWVQHESRSQQNSVSVSAVDGSAEGNRTIKALGNVVTSTENDQ